MNVAQAMEWLEGMDPGAELAVTARFPELDGWEVTSWAVDPGEAEGSPRAGDLGPVGRLRLHGAVEDAAARAPAADGEAGGGRRARPAVGTGAVRRGLRGPAGAGVAERE